MDAEANGEIDRDDLVRVILRLCEFCKKQLAFEHLPRPKRKEAEAAAASEAVEEKQPTPPREAVDERSPAVVARIAFSACLQTPPSSNTPTKKKLPARRQSSNKLASDNMTLMSSKLGHR